MVDKNYIVQLKMLLHEIEERGIKVVTINEVTHHKAELEIRFSLTLEKKGNEDGSTRNRGETLV